MLGDSLKTINTDAGGGGAAGSGAGSGDPAALVEPNVENACRMLPAPKGCSKYLLRTANLVLGVNT